VDDVTALVDRYFALWNTPDPALRHRLCDEVWTADALYADPRADALGRAEIEAMMTGVHEVAPGVSFRRLGDVQTHHGFLSYAWEMSGPGGIAVGGGVSFAEIAQGRLRRLVGFFDEKLGRTVASDDAGHAEGRPTTMGDGARSASREVKV
jgi:hypothetical protein